MLMIFVSWLLLQLPLTVALLGICTWAVMFWNVENSNRDNSEKTILEGTQLYTFINAWIHYGTSTSYCMFYWDKLNILVTFRIFRMIIITFTSNPVTLDYIYFMLPADSETTHTTYHIKSKYSILRFTLRNTSTRLITLYAKILCSAQCVQLSRKTLILRTTGLT